MRLPTYNKMLFDHLSDVLMNFGRHTGQVTSPKEEKIILAAVTWYCLVGKHWLAMTVHRYRVHDRLGEISLGGMGGGGGGGPDRPLLMDDWVRSQVGAASAAAPSLFDGSVG